MQIHDYSKAAIRSESKIPEVKGVGAVSLHAALTAVIGVGDVMDQIKKNVFYNRPYDREKLADSINASIGALTFLYQSVQPNGGFADPEQSLDIHRMTANDGPTGKAININADALKQIDPRIFHVITGIITEASELAEALQLNIEGDPLDLVNVSEEIGDIAWYGFGIFPDASEIPPGQILDTNIGKLARRYPEKFDAWLAQQENRALDEERAILEEGAVSYYVSGVREADGNCEIVPDDQADFFTVYRRKANGESEAVSDHNTRAEAEANLPAGN